MAWIVLTLKFYVITDTGPLLSTQETGKPYLLPATLTVISLVLASDAVSHARSLHQELTGFSRASGLASNIFRKGNYEPLWTSILYSNNINVLIYLPF